MFISGLLRVGVVELFLWVASKSCSYIFLIICIEIEKDYCLVVYLFHMLYFRSFIKSCRLQNKFELYKGVENQLSLGSPGLYLVYTIYVIL